MTSVLPKRLTLLPSLILPFYSKRALLLEYQPLKFTYSIREIEFKINGQIQVFPLNETKFLALGYWDSEDVTPVAFVYDLTSHKKLDLDYLKLTDVISPYSKGENWTFFANYLRVNKNVIMTINKKDPTKFKTLKDVIPRVMINTENEIKQLSSQWLAIKFKEFFQLYYREDSNFEYKIRTTIQTETNFCDFHYENEGLAILSLTRDGYEVLILRGDGTFKRVSKNLSDEFDTSSKYLTCLGVNTISILYYYESWKHKVAILSFNTKGKVIRTQTLDWSKLPTPLNDDYLIHTSKNFLEIWYREKLGEDYKLQFKVETTHDNPNPFVILSSLNARREVVKYLSSLIKLPKDLVASTVEFF